MFVRGQASVNTSADIAAIYAKAWGTNAPASASLEQSSGDFQMRPGCCFVSR
jgi:hypothetical protein